MMKRAALRMVAAGVGCASALVGGTMARADFTFGNLPNLAPHVEDWEVMAATQTGGKLAMTYQDPKSDTLASASSDCLALTYGGNLASCLTRCSDKVDRAALLSEEPDYEAVWRASRSEIMTGDPTVSMGRGNLEMRIGWFGSRKHLRVKTRKQGGDALCRTELPVDPVACVREVSASVTGVDPVAGYQELLQKTAVEVRVARDAGAIRDRKAADEIVEKLDRLVKGLGSLTSLLDSAGIAGFQRTGVFLVKNITHSPALVCQLRSQSAGVGGPSVVLRSKIDENLAEIERSTDFIERLGASSQ